MLTFIIPTYRNPNGLLNTLLSLKDINEGGIHCIVLMDKHDESLAHNVIVCEESGLAPMTVRYLVFETPSLTARVNYACYLASTRFISVISDDIIIGKSTPSLESKVKTAVAPCLDEILLLYLCKREEGDYGYRFPIVSKRFFEIAGYIYHPICANPATCERWLGSVFDQIGRIRTVQGIDITLSQEYPCNIRFSEETIREAEYLYSKCTANVRRAQANTLSKFLIKE